MLYLPIAVFKQEVLGRTFGAYIPSNDSVHVVRAARTRNK
jgi:hypothetical protein